MRAARIHRFGGPEVIAVEDVPMPVPGDGEVLVRVRFGGLNFADTERRRGLYLADQPLPTTLGFEGCGVVEAVGAGVGVLWQGRRVAFIAPHAHAEFVCVPVAGLIALPDEVSDEVGAAFPVQGLTAFHALFTVGRLARGERVVITAAAGGVGHLALQLARAAGAHVIAVVGKPEKVDVALRFGAHEVLVRGTAEVARLRDEVDVLIDVIGAGFTDVALRMLAPFGRWVHVGEEAGAPPPVAVEQLFAKSLSVTAYWLRTPHGVHRETGHAAVLSALLAGSLQVEMSRVLSLETLADGHEDLERGTTIGKLILRV